MLCVPVFFSHEICKVKNTRNMRNENLTKCTDSLNTHLKNVKVLEFLGAMSMGPIN